MFDEASAKAVALEIVSGALSNSYEDVRDELTTEM